MRYFRDVLDAPKREASEWSMLPTIGWNLRRGQGYECRLSWEGIITVTGRGKTRGEASGNAAALFNAARWFVNRKEGQA